MEPINLHLIAVEAMRSRGLLPVFAPQALREVEAARQAGPERNGVSPLLDIAVLLAGRGYRLANRNYQLFALS